MPFRSEAQRRFLWARHPEIARKWADEERMSLRGHEKKLKAKKKLRRVL
jgi:hypothetical protein